MIAAAVNAFVTLKDSATPDMPGIDRETVRGVWASEAQEVLAATLPALRNWITDDLEKFAGNLGLDEQQMSAVTLVLHHFRTEMVL